MKERTAPCKKCGAFDFYYYGNFSYCRPCAREASKRYIARKALGEQIEYKHPAPSAALSDLVERPATKLFCPRGHLMTGDNVFNTRQYKRNHLNRKCRVCDRNRRRVEYGLSRDDQVTKLSDLLDT